MVTCRHCPHHTPRTRQCQTIPILQTPLHLLRPLIIEEDLNSAVRQASAFYPMQRTAHHGGRQRREWSIVHRPPQLLPSSPSSSSASLSWRRTLPQTTLGPHDSPYTGYARGGEVNVWDAGGVPWRRLLRLVCWCWCWCCWCCGTATAGPTALRWSRHGACVLCVV